MNTVRRVAVVTGGNRGLGLETCRQLAKAGLDVLLTSREPVKGQAATDELNSEGLLVSYFPLEITNSSSIVALKEFLEQKCGRLDVLINNAGVFLDPLEEAGSIFKTKLETLYKTMATNVYGPLELCNALIPLMHTHHYGRIVNVSSGMGQLTNMNGRYPGYRLSKVGLNVLTRILADELQGTNILVNSVAPGFVETGLGSPKGHRSQTVEEGVDTTIWLATLPDEGPTGGFFSARQIIPW